MRARPILIAVGLVLAGIGALFLLQGRGIVRWPADSFMIGEQAWVTYGAVIAVFGLVLILAARRLR